MKKFQFQEDKVCFDVIGGTKCFKLTAKSSHKIQDVKKKLRKAGWQEEELLNLMHTGECLRDHLSLAYYDIRNVCNSLFRNS